MQPTWAHSSRGQLAQPYQCSTNFLSGYFVDRLCVYNITDRPAFICLTLPVFAGQWSMSFGRGLPKYRALSNLLVFYVCWLTIKGCDSDGGMDASGRSDLPEGLKSGLS